VLEYTVAAAAVAVGWSAHVFRISRRRRHHLARRAQPWRARLPARPASNRRRLRQRIVACAAIDLPAVAIGAIVTALLIIGTRESATVNLISGGDQAGGAGALRRDRLDPFSIPRAFIHSRHTDSARGSDRTASSRRARGGGADLSSPSTVSMRCRPPRKKPRIPRAISRSASWINVICTAIYIAVAAAALGAASWREISSTGAPLVHVWSFCVIPSRRSLSPRPPSWRFRPFILVLMYGQSRIWFVMARDGLLPERLAALTRRAARPSR